MSNYPDVYNYAAWKAIDIICPVSYIISWAVGQNTFETLSENLCKATQRELDPCLRQALGPKKKQKPFCLTGSLSEIFQSSEMPQNGGELIEWSHQTKQK